MIMTYSSRARAVAIINLPFLRNYDSPQKIRHTLSNRFPLYFDGGGHLPNYTNSRIFFRLEFGATVASCLLVGIFGRTTFSLCAPRPPQFGSSLPTINNTGLITRTAHITAAKVESGVNAKTRDDCPLCKKFGSGPCGFLFNEWLSCTDRHPGKDEQGEPLHLAMCSDFTQKLAECLESNADYYEEKHGDEANRIEDEDMEEEMKELRKSWDDFVHETENGIESKKYKSLPFPQKFNPKMEVQPKTKTCAAYFVSEIDDGSVLFAAYILSDNGDVVAAGSRDDMDMGTFGCILQFDMPEGMKSATCRGIYETDANSVTIFSRTLMVPDALYAKN